MVTSTQTRRWHAPVRIPFFTALVDNMLEMTQEQLRHLEKAKGKAHVLDDVTIRRVLKAQKEQNTNVVLFRGQCQHWRHGPLTYEQRQAVSQLEEKIAALESTGRQISFLAEHYEHHTINNGSYES